MAEPFVRPMDYASPSEKHESHGHPSEIKKTHPQIDPSGNTSEIGKVHKTVAEEEKEERSKFNWRIIFVIMALLFMVVAIYFLVKLGGAVFGSIFGSNTPTEQQVTVDTDTRLRSTISDTQLKPEERVDSRLNIVALDVPYGPSGVLGASTTSPEYRVAPETGPRDYSPYYNPYATETSAPCSDYMGNRYACLPSYYTDYGMRGAAPERYNYAPPSGGVCADYMGNRYSCVQNNPPSYYENTPYYDNRGTSYDYYNSSRSTSYYSPERCRDYMGNTYACLPPYYTDYGMTR